MVDKSRRDRVGLGVIGLGPSWEQVYREPLVRLQSRLTIRLVYDPVEARSKSVASELEAEVAGSLRQILTRHTLQGLLVLDPGWCGIGVLNLIARSGKPAFLAAPVLRHASTLISILSPSAIPASLEGQTSKANDQMMPELGLRYTPASCRLRELIATKLGPARHIRIDCDLTANFDEIAALVDWCTDIMGQVPTISASVTKEPSTGAMIEFDFTAIASPASPSTAGKRTAKLRQHQGGHKPLRIEIECARGHAVLLNRTHITWRTESDFADESLTDERTELEILIDQFCRRALGGLNPIGRLSDFVRALEIVQSIRQGLV